MNAMALPWNCHGPDLRICNGNAMAIPRWPPSVTTYNPHQLRVGHRGGGETIIPKGRNKLVIHVRNTSKWRGYMYMSICIIRNKNMAVRQEQQRQYATEKWNPKMQRFSARRKQ
jgi:hypothetical protein